jgi:hypothetical protein
MEISVPAYPSFFRLLDSRPDQPESLGIPGNCPPGHRAGSPAGQWRAVAGGTAPEG